jgi:dipeptidyl aminopeptidase/acylaminoacyl peptidase
MKKTMYRSCLWIACVLVALTAIAQAEEKPRFDTWTPEFQMKFRGIRGTAISPDGSLVAYVVREPIMEEEKSEYLDHIWVVSADGSSDIQYTRGDASAASPAFSPDGRYLAFLSKRSEKTQVWMMHVRGGEAEQVTECEGNVSSFKWSPDGTRIGFIMADPETEEEEERKKQKRDVILVDKNFHYSHIYAITVEKDDEGARRTERITEGEFHVTGFDWSPEGQTIVFAFAPDPRLNQGYSNRDISIVAADGGEIEPLVSRAGVDGGPLYSPDGKWVAFTSHGGRPEPIGLQDVWVVPAGGGEPKMLAETPNRSAGLIAWSGDSKTIYLTETVRTSNHVIALPIDGAPARQVSAGEGVIRNIAFGPSVGRLSYTFEKPEEPVEVYISAIDSFEMKRLTDVNHAVPRPAMGRTELLRWESTDGFEIEGLLTYPVSYEDGKSYPLILNVHGGPAGAFTQSFTGNPGIYMIQTFAQNGFAVLRPNPRGSTGYGKDFRYANFKDWGFGDADDLLAGVDKVIDMGVADPEKLCLMGWSYGGYMTSFMVTRTNRFKAASMGAGLPNLVSMVTTTDIPDYLAAHMGGEFWLDYETYEKHSAMYRIKNVTTPTQVIHGAQDLRVPFTQGQEFYVALTRLGVPTEMIVYPRTPHGPREPKFLMDVTPRILAWFEKHLKGAESTTN